MTHYADLSICDYLGSGQALAVGWLDLEHDFSRGRVDRGCFETLAGLLVDPWQPAVAVGRHECQFCAFTGGPAELRVGDVSVRIGASNVFVPSREAIYVAPSTILHYIDAHEYLPPEVFRRAVLECPPMRSMQYLRAIREHGLKHLRAP